VATITKKRIEEDMTTLPPSFPQSFYRVLNAAAKKAGMARAAFAMKAIKFYSAALEKRTAPATKALGPIDADKYAEMSRKVSQSWWAKLTPEEKSARSKKALDARWGKKKKK
jgi:hypothetical protein